jgi:hypothetical protein
MVVQYDPLTGLYDRGHFQYGNGAVPAPGDTLLMEFHTHPFGFSDTVEFAYAPPSGLDLTQIANENSTTVVGVIQAFDGHTYFYGPGNH